MAPHAAVAAAAGLAWPVLSHGAALAGRPDWMPTITAGTAVVILTALAIGTRRGSTRAFLLLALVGVALVWRFAPLLLLFVPPAAINVAFGMFFASTLRKGREPRIATFARRERGEALPPDLGAYARQVTWVWTLFFFASAVFGLVLAATAPLSVWSTYCNVVSYALVGLLLVGEHYWRKHRFPQYRHAPLLAQLAGVAHDRRPW